jgi:thioredoxin 1
MNGILYFSAPWCGPCQQLSPIINQLVSEGINIKKVNIDYDTNLSQKYTVRSIPTLILTDMNGNEIKRMSGGGKTKEQIKSWFNN